MLANGTRTSANVWTPEDCCKIRRKNASTDARERRRIVKSSMWWARQDSNLQPDRYERSDLIAKSSKINAAHAFLCTFERVCSRGFCGVTVGLLSMLATASADLKDALRATGEPQRHRAAAKSFGLEWAFIDLENGSARLRDG
jgi:hypothetical protein